MNATLVEVMLVPLAVPNATLLTNALVEVMFETVVFASTVNPPTAKFVVVMFVAIRFAGLSADTARLVKKAFVLVIEVPLMLVANVLVVVTLPPVALLNVSPTVLKLVLVALVRVV